ncbi:MAG: amidohydrolase family protein [Pseudomonadota bacterium]
MATGGNTGAGALAGIAFMGCDMMPTASLQPVSAQPAAAGAAAAAKPGARRREVVVDGKRVKTVDVHAHCGVPEAIALMGLQVTPGTLLMTDPTERLRKMDEQGIDVEALSINPYWYGTPRDLAAELIKIQNAKLAEIHGSLPERFVCFATVALQHPELAAEQLAFAVKTYGFRGVSIGGSVEGTDLSDPKFNPFWAKAEELGVLVFMHPQGTKELEPSGRLKGSGLLTNTIGNPLETTIALSHLIFDGTLDRYPGLKICAAHGGGYLPSYCARSDAVCRTFPETVGKLPKKKPTEYLKQLYFDTIVFTSEALRHLIAETGSSQILMGTDYPFPWTSTSVDHILDTPGLSDAERVAILGGTAARLLGIKD